MTELMTSKSFCENTDQNHFQLEAAGVRPMVGREAHTAHRVWKERRELHKESYCHPVVGAELDLVVGIYFLVSWGLF